MQPVLTLVNQMPFHNKFSECCDEDDEEVQSAVQSGIVCRSVRVCVCVSVWECGCVRVGVYVQVTYFVGGLQSQKSCLNLQLYS